MKQVLINISVVVALVVVIVVGVRYLNSSEQKIDNTPAVSNNNEAQNVGTSTPEESDFIPDSGTVSSSNGWAASVTTTPVLASTAIKNITVEEVAKHNSPENCWTIVNGNVYDVTAWISKHPGGSGAILRMCGADGSAGFGRKHGGQEKPEAVLESFKIGVLAK